VLCPHVLKGAERTDQLSERRKERVGD
jgi:hypothetical protein